MELQIHLPNLQLLLSPHVVIAIASDILSTNAALETDPILVNPISKLILMKKRDTRKHVHRYLMTNKTIKILLLNIIRKHILITIVQMNKHLIIIIEHIHVNLTRTYQIK